MHAFFYNLLKYFSYFIFILSLTKVKHTGFEQHKCE